MSRKDQAVPMAGDRKVPGLIGLVDRALIWITLTLGGATLTVMSGFSV